MKKTIFALTLGLFFLSASNSYADNQFTGEDADLNWQQNERVYTIYVGTGFLAKRKCFDYQGRDVVVEGDMRLRVYKAVYWTDGSCDLYY